MRTYSSVVFDGREEGIVYFSIRIDEYCKAKKIAKNGSKLVDMIDNLLSRIIELRAAVNDRETAALDLQMHCVRSLMVCRENVQDDVFDLLFQGILRTIGSFTDVYQIHLSII